MLWPLHLIITISAVDLCHLLTVSQNFTFSFYVISNANNILFLELLKKNQKARKFVVIDEGLGFYE